MNVDNQLLYIYVYMYSATMFCRYFHELGFNHVSIGEDSHRETKDGLPDPRLKYYKFMIVRHPLERLASAFLDKVVDPSPNDLPDVKKIKVRVYFNEI